MNAGLQLDKVTHFEALFEKYDEASDEIAEDRLQAETNADAEGTDDKRELGEVDSNGRQSNKETDGQDGVMG